MAASINDLATQGTNGTRPSPTTLTAIKSVGASSISCGALTGWPTATAVHFIIYTTNTNGAKVAGSQTDWKGIVSGTTITGLVLKAGTDNGYSVGAVVEAAPTAAWANDVYSAIVQDHDSQGRHSKLTDTNGVKIMGLTPVASAVNNAGMSNSATGLDVDEYLEGTDSNISKSFTPKGTGQFYFKKRFDGWTTGLPTPNTVTYNGNRNYSLVFNSVDLTGYISNGMRLRFTRTVTAPTQCTDLESGSSQYYSKTTPTGVTFTTTFSCGGWVKLESYGAGGVIARRNGSTEGWSFGVNANGQVEIAAFRIAANNRFNASVQALPLNKWFHIAATMDVSVAGSGSGAYNFYIDGALVTSGTETLTGTITALVQGTTALVVGSQQSAGLNFFDGKLSQVFVNSTVLSAATIAAMQTQILTGAETGAVAEYSFNGVITDLTANANNLTAQGSAVATSIDSPFAGGAAASTAYTAGTTEFGEVFNVSFSTNTTVVVQVPDGYTIPTSGGVSALAYSVSERPLGWSRISNVLALTELKTNFATSSGSLVDVTGLTLTCYIPSNRTVKVTAFCPVVTASVSNNGGVFAIIDTTDSRQLTSGSAATNASGDGAHVDTSATIYPSSGSRSFKVQAARATNAATATFNATTTAPIFLMVELV